MLNTVEPLPAFQLEECGNKYTPQNVVLVVVHAGVVRPKFRRPQRVSRREVNRPTVYPRNVTKCSIYLL
jgi:hypothetical protein